MHSPSTAGSLRTLETGAESGLWTESGRPSAAREAQGMPETKMSETGMCRRGTYLTETETEIPEHLAGMLIAGMLNHGPGDMTMTGIAAPGSPAGGNLRPLIAHALYSCCLSPVCTFHHEEAQCGVSDCVEMMLRFCAIAFSKLCFIAGTVSVNATLTERGTGGDRTFTAVAIETGGRTSETGGEILGTEAMTRGMTGSRGRQSPRRARGSWCVSDAAQHLDGSACTPVPGSPILNGTANSAMQRRLYQKRCSPSEHQIPDLSG